MPARWVSTIGPSKALAWASPRGSGAPLGCRGDGELSARAS
jgi:hypothetical protein